MGQGPCRLVLSGPCRARQACSLGPVTLQYSICSVINRLARNNSSARTSRQLAGDAYICHVYYTNARPSPTALAIEACGHHVNIPIAAVQRR